MSSDLPAAMDMEAPWLDEIGWNERGLVPAIAQDEENGTVLMVAWMNRQALCATAELGRAVYWSRSRGKLWHKGESSGNFQVVSEIRLDCDADVILLRVHQHGGIACHTGRVHCFYRKLSNGCWQSVEPVIRDPGEIYPDRS